MHRTYVVAALFLTDAQVHVLVHAINLLRDTLVSTLVHHQASMHAHVRTRDRQLRVVSDLSLVSCDLLQLT